MHFFVPETSDPEEAERAYAEMSEACGRQLPPPDKRIYSLRYVHNGRYYRATVGEPREVTIYPRTRGKVHYNPATATVFKTGRVIHAIFAGEPTFRILEGGEGRSEFANPTEVGPRDISGEPDYFDIG
jgi:hypothetical protein